ncbi:MAG: hypothetical protein LBU27_03910 [Candidatus Peribacteria bacterium]|jgi:hypothetical protein|nr:hypothetical protein [Candidatus Peribacteria bacterium]
MYAQEKTKYQTSVISKLDTDTILRGIGEQGETFAVKYNINNKGEVSEVGNGDKKMDLSISDLADSAVYKEVIAKLENAYKTENDNKKRNNYKTVFINTIKKATDKSVVESLIKVDTSSTGNGKEAIRKDLVGNKRTFTDTQNGTKTTFKLNDQGKLEKENVTTPPTTTTPTPTAPTPTTPTPTTPAPTS